MSIFSTSLMTTPDDHITPDDTLNPVVEEDPAADCTPEPAIVEAAEEFRPSQHPSSQPPLTVWRIAAISAVMAGVVWGVLDRSGPHTPRTPRVVGNDPQGEGGASDGSKGDSGAGPDPDGPKLCGRDPKDLHPKPHVIYGIDGVHVQNGSVDEEPCEPPIMLEDGREIWTGHEVVDGENSRVCWFTRPWAPGAAIRLAGTIEGNDKVPGVIHLRDGLIEIQNGIQIDPAQPIEEKEIKVAGEASLAITSTERVSVTILPPQKDATPEMANKMRVRVSSQAGETTIVQEGREPITLTGCEEKIIPLDVQQVNGGCYIVEGGLNENGFSQKGNALILFAGAAFLALRRRKRGNNGEK